jgi:putative ABC transport system substrate-binding protein
VKRREFISLLGGAAAAWPLAARAQQPAMPVIGFLNTASPGAYTARVRAFHQGLNETGYAEGRNVAIVYRWAEGQSVRLPELAADLVAQRVSVITGANIAAALAAKAMTTTIPIVFAISVDPVEVGLVASLNRPGGNITGATTLGAELGPKRLELLHEVIPAASNVAFLVNPTAPIAESLTRDMQKGARALGLQLHVLHASTEHDFDTVFATLAGVNAGALVISTDPFFNSQSEPPANGMTMASTCSPMALSSAAFSRCTRHRRVRLGCGRWPLATMRIARRRAATSRRGRPRWRRSRNAGSGSSSKIGR